MTDRIERPLVGLDLDHTLVSYGPGLRRWAETLGVPEVAGGSLKDAVRRHCRESEAGDELWQQVQADLYGPGMEDAVLAAGARECLLRLKEAGVPVAVVSHKTEYAAAAPGGPSLRETALGWMAARGLFDGETGLSAERVYFESTRAEKVARIASLECTYFVDDLPEVFREDSFPDGVRRLLYAPDGAGGAAAVDVVVGSWAAVADRVLSDAGVARWTQTSALLGGEAFSMLQLPGGRNSAVYRVETQAGDACVAKCYRDATRMTTEVAALRYMAAAGVAMTPGVIAVGEAPPMVLMSEVVGEAPVTVDAADIDQAVAFLAGVNRVSPARATWTLRAVEAGISFQDVSDAVEQRAARLLEVSSESGVFADMRAFVRDELLGLLARTSLDAATGLDPLPREAWVLSPSDFGFHNAVRHADGRLTFLDFEYFGWDDPAKLVADFVWHPAMALSEDLRRRFVAGVAAALDGGACLAKRLPVAYALFGLKWCTILLNEFLPEHWERRVHAGESREHATALVEQLEKARGVARDVAAGRVRGTDIARLQPF